MDGNPVDDGPVDDELMMMQFEFRNAVEEDIPELVKLGKETIAEVYGEILSEDRLEPWIKGDRMRSNVIQLWRNMIVAERESEIVAVAAYFEDKVALLWVHPAHHRKGIGSILLGIVETELKNSGHEVAKLDCFSDNERAMGFYLAQGWKPLFEEMDQEVGALKTVMAKTLKKEGWMVSYELEFTAENHIKNSNSQI